MNSEIAPREHAAHGDSAVFALRVFDASSLFAVRCNSRSGCYYWNFR